MSRATIDFGIDLGTTNSAIALLRGTQIQMFKNNENQEITPSAVYLDPNGVLFVGNPAKGQLEFDPENAFAEFKLSMGQPKAYQFARSGRVMRPAELSAEVLKALKASVQQRSGQEVEAAVITVPAAFELPACDATREAARLAGLTFSPLLQEPIAAGLAYGFQDESDKVFWLVYDLGGGTFDAAIIQVRDGQIKVIHHEGDNFLGGKLIDWAIVEQLFIPALLSQHQLADFRRGNPRWSEAIAKLKERAEWGKIQVSSYPSVQISTEFDAHNQRIRFEYQLKRSDVERLAEPFLLRSINLCKKTLSEARLAAKNIERVLLVGGPTLAPYLRDRLADPKEGLGIPLEFQVDPLTVVAQGAAIYAGTQPLQKREGPPVPVQPGQFTLAFTDWQFMGSDPEPPIAGVVKAPAGENFEGLTLEFLNADARPQWRSGQIPLSPTGGFIATLRATKGRPNRIQVELRDRTGRLLPVVTTPDPLTYLVGVDLPSPPLPHSVGVELVNDEVEWLLEKGQELPARRRKTLLTAFEVRQGQTGDVLRIPVVEGEYPRADLNRRIGRLEVQAHQVKRTIPIGTEVEVTIDIDQSRLVRAKAFLPLLDDEFECVIDYHRDVASAAALKQALEQERERLRKLRARVNEPTAQHILDQIDQERIVEEVAAAIEAMGAEPEAGDRADKRLIDLKAQLYRIENALKWPDLVQEAKELLPAVRDLVSEHGSQEHRRRLQRLEAETEEAVRSGNADLLTQRLDALRRLGRVVLDEVDALPLIYFEKLCKQETRAQMRDQARARELIVAGNRAIQNKEMGRLRAINLELSDLLPNPPPPPDASTVMRK